ncbi:MAG: hypothetical protein R2820_14635 [Cyclobacteriaceae bacterium]
MSHVKNVDGYSRLVDVCTGYGGRFNPGHSTLQLKAMRALLKEAQSSLHIVKQTKTDYNNVTNEREILFEEIRKRVTPILRMLKSSGATAQTMADANRYARLIQGRVKSRPPVPSAESDEQQESAEKSIRQRLYTQQSFVSRAEHFGWLIQTVESQTGYQPNEPELQVGSLRVLLNEALASIDKVAKAYVAWANARIKRNKVLYTADDAMYGNAQAVKAYVSAVFGTQSEEYQELTRISFTKYRR